MAPNKKKKKTLSNPARGFATTSTASKPKHDLARELESGVLLDGLHNHELPMTTHNSIRTEECPNEKRDKALHELTPEELESQLEDSSLQILVEKHGEKVKREASRQVSKMQTEKRLLRSQADRLSIRRWLPPEIMQIIIGLLQAQEDSIGYLKTNLVIDNAITNICEDDLLIKLWTLKRVLSLLNISEQRTDLALRHLIIAMTKSGPNSLGSGKEPVWGLDECLTGLALNSGPVDLPNFEGREGPSHFSADKKPPRVSTSTSVTSKSTPITTPSVSRPASPLSREHPPQEAPNDEANTLSSASDSDSDAEPEQLVTKYLKLQSCLHEISPDLTQDNARRHRRGKGKNPVIDSNLDYSKKQRIERLRTKIHKIKSDILFDQDAADSRWADIHVDLAQEAAERKRLGIRSGGEQEKVTSCIHNSRDLAKSNDDDDDDDTDGMLSGFFSSLPETVTDPATGSSIISTTNQDGRSVEIRDFGTWTGMSPRRVLEEACRAR